MIRTLLIAVLFSILGFACNKESTIGSELDDDVLVPSFTDTFSVKTYTVRDDSVLTYTPLEVRPTYISGRTIDPIFGVSEAQMNLQLGLNTLLSFASDAVLDSVVLSVALDTVNKGYGITDESVFNYEVYEILEDLVVEDDYYSNHFFSLSNKSLGSVNAFQPKFSGDSSMIYEPNSTGSIDTVSVFPQMRIRLTEGYGYKLLKLDSTALSTPANFLLEIKGLSIIPEALTNAMINFDVYDRNTGVNLYYHEGDLFKKAFFPVAVSNVATSTFVNDLTGTPIEKQLQDTTNYDSILYLQALGTSVVQFEFPSLSALENVSVNHASIEFTVAIPEGYDTSLYSLVDQLILYEVKNDSSLVLIDDVRNQVNTSLIGNVFGGRLQNENNTLNYSMNITQQFQKMIKGTSTRVWRLVPEDRVANANRSVLYGSNSSLYKPKVKITYTPVNR